MLCFTHRSSQTLFNLFLAYYMPIMIVSIVGSFAIACAAACCILEAG